MGVVRTTRRAVSIGGVALAVYRWVQRRRARGEAATPANPDHAAAR
ncbi:MAG: hypothetical protein JWM05_942 [Acidimicrobiales bacterium]|nr:hypothetical protein [Acidimicrobiales bacterium]